MKVLSKSDRVLEFKVRPSWETAIPFLIVALFLLGLFNGGRILKIQKSEDGIVTASHAWRYLGIDFGRQETEGVRHLHVDLDPNHSNKIRVHCTSDRNSFQAIFNMGSDATLGSVRMMQNHLESIAEEANHLIEKSGQGMVAYDTTSRQIGIWVVGPFFLGMLVLISQNSSGRIDLDRGLLYLRQVKRLKTSEQTFSLDEVEGFFLWKKGFQSNCIVVDTKSEGTIELSWPGPGVKRRNRLVETVNEFLNSGKSTKPVENDTPVSQGKMCDICGASVEGSPRCRDSRGRYYHQVCFEQNRGI